MTVLYITIDTLFVVFLLWISLSNICLVKTAIVLGAREVRKAGWRGWGAGAAQREGDPRQLTPKAGLGRVPSAADDVNAFGILGS